MLFIYTLLSTRAFICSLVLTVSFPSANAQAPGPCSFSDNFNRPDGPVDNGWFNSPSNANGNLLIRNGKLSTPGPNGYDGIYRPIPPTPIKVSSTVTDLNGFGGLLRRYDTAFLTGTDGSFSTGYGVSFNRGDQNFNDSSVRLILNGSTLVILNSTFQFDTSIDVSFTIFADGSIVGAVTGGANTFNFNFGPMVVTFAGNNFAIVQGLPDGRSALIQNPTVDNLVLTYNCAMDRSFQVRYASNLNTADSIINLTNTGANGAPPNGPGFGGAVGNICVNVYAFSPDEQLVSCCSCLITPNGLASLSVNNDLVSNTLTGIRPNSIVIKLLNTGAGAAYTGTSCSSSAALAGAANFPLASGLLAYGTTVHAGPAAGSFSVIETPFSGAALSAAELASVTNRCTNIIGNGSTFGICRSCRPGGLNASN